MTNDEILKIADKVGATYYSPPPMRAVRGKSFTYEQLEAFTAKIIEQDRLTRPQAAQEWMPIELAPKDRILDIFIDSSGRRYIDCYWNSICCDFHKITQSGKLIRLKGATHYMPSPAAPQPEKKQ